MINTASHPLAIHKIATHKRMTPHRRFAGLLCGLLLSILTQAACADTATLSYDPAGNILSRTSPAGITTTYGYDGLNRLVSESGPGGILSYAYDANGNRVSDNLGSYTYSPASNQLATRHGAGVTLDAAGNITTDGLGHTFSYNQMGRLYQVFKGGVLYASYYYNYQGERTRKVTTAAAPQGAQTVIYHYDIAGHLLGESSGTGAALRTYIWRDNTPLAQIDYVPSRRVIYFDTDHLNTPRAARDQTGAVVWRWEGDAFGATPPNQNPSGKGIVTVNLRFPGQYFDQESGLSYNANRDYDPGIGRYVESDPIGLAGGSLSTYAYVNGNPLRWSDPFGLAPGDPYPSQHAAATAAISEIIPVSILRDTEYGGMIYLQPSGEYSYTQPRSLGKAGGTQTGDPGGPKSCPADSKSTAYYHTHGDYDQRYNNENFSDPDLNYADHFNIDGYLGTPSGALKYYNHNSTAITTIGSVPTK